MHFPQPTYLAEGEIRCTSRTRSVLDTNARLHSSLTGTGAITSAFRGTNTPQRHKATATRNASTAHLPPVRQRIHRLSSIVETLRSRASQLGRGKEADALGSSTARGNAPSATRQAAPHTEFHQRAHVVQISTRAFRTSYSLHEAKSSMRNVRSWSMDR